MSADRYTTIAKWRNGWHLIERDGKRYMRRAYRGQYAVTAERDGLVWVITDPVTGERIDPNRLR